MIIQKNNKNWERVKSRSQKDAWSSEVEVGDFLYGFVRAVKPENCLEIGTFEGDGAVAIGKGLRANKLGKLITIDVKDFGQEAVIDKAGLSEYIEIYKSDSIISEFKNSSFDMIWIDDGHSYEEATRDLENANRLCMRDGYIIGHDVVSVKTVRRAYNDFIRKYGNLYENIIIASYDGLFVMRKK
jgi:predicted O-methyltransferase YrrM